MALFRDDLHHFVYELQRARRSEFVEIRNIFKGLFGETVTESAVRSYLTQASNPTGQSSFQPGKGFLAAPALVSPARPGAANTPKAAPHSFHPGKLKK